jgi:glycosyltransferase involved in cell wall biosynthesis
MPRRVTAVSTDMAEGLRRHTRTGHVDVVGNVVGPIIPAPRGTAPGIRLLAVGGLVDVKDPLLAVQTVGVLRRAGHDVTLRWAGSGGLADAVREAAHLEGISGHVTLLGSVPPEELGVQFAWATTFVLPTRHETFCVAAAEALAHGRPVVVGAVGGQRDFVGSNVGVLVGSRDPSAWAAAVLDARDRFETVRPEQFAGAVERFRPERVAQAFDEVYARARCADPADHAGGGADRSGDHDLGRN